MGKRKQKKEIVRLGDVLRELSELNHGDKPCQAFEHWLSTLCRGTRAVNALKRLPRTGELSQTAALCWLEDQLYGTAPEEQRVLSENLERADEGRGIDYAAVEAALLSFWNKRQARKRAAK